AVGPTGNVEPLGGSLETVATPQLSSAIGVKLTTAEHWPASLVATMSLGQFSVGGVPSTTVTLKEQLGPFDAVQTTGVAPTSKNEPDGGSQVSGPHGPSVVGSG